MQITSVQNQKIKETLRLRDRKGRDETGLFLIEGERELERAMAAGIRPATIFFCPDLCKKKIPNGIECTKEVFAKLSYRESPDGILAVAPQVHRSLADLILKPNPFLVIAESIEKPGNLGTILRSCDAAGVDAVIVCDPTTDIYNPNVVRSSMGTLFTVPVIEATSAETMAYLKQHNIAIAAATPHAKIEYTQANFKIPVAIAVGTEHTGLTEEWMKRADIQVRIPMRGKADSLNVASATTLVLYEVIRQRN